MGYPCCMIPFSTFSFLKTPNKNEKLFYVLLRLTFKAMTHLSIISIIELIDRKLLLLINGTHAPWADQLFWSVTQTYAWIPFYLMAIFLIWFCYRKKAWKVLLIIALAVAMADIVSSGILKPLVQRPRPTHTPGLAEQLHLYLRPNGTYYKGGPYSFPSSHATNSSTIAILLFHFLRPFQRKQWPLALFLIFYVLIFCYTRPYFGVHYPTDILTGWLLGIALCLPIAALTKTNAKMELSIHKSC